MHSFAFLSTHPLVSPDQLLQRAAAHNALIQPTLSRPRAVTTMHLPRILPLVPLQAAAILPNCVWSEIWRAGRRPGCCCPYLRSAARPLTPSMVARLFLPSRKSRRVQRTAHRRAPQVFAHGRICLDRRGRRRGAASHRQRRSLLTAAAVRPLTHDRTESPPHRQVAAQHATCQQVLCARLPSSTVRRSMAHHCPWSRPSFCRSHAAIVRSGMLGHRLH